MTDNNISVRTRIGSYDWLHPNEKQLMIFIHVDGRQISLSMNPERYEYLINEYAWDEYVPDVIKIWLDDKWISTQKHLVEVILRWSQTRVGRRRLAQAYWTRERDRAAKALAAATEDLERATRMLSVLAEEELEDE